MPTLEFSGKPIVYAYHFGVPFRPLVPDFGKSVLLKGKGGKKGAVLEDANLLIHGDNLHALKALMPRYAGRINCVCIDPPYNTGNEGWAYNDNVNSPLMRRWLAENGVVDCEDLERHDKWLCMMWPRLQLLHELLADDGVIFISIDENEQHRLTLVMEEIFGEENHLATLVWAGRGGKGGTNRGFAQSHEYILCFAKDHEKAKIKSSVSVLEQGNHRDARGEYRREQLRQWGQGDRRRDRPAMFFPVQAPDGADVYPKRPDGDDGRWRYGEPRVRAMLEAGDLDFVKQKGEWTVYRKIRKGQERISATDTLLLNYGTASTGTLEMKQIFGDKAFDTAKPTALIKHLVDLVCWNKKDALILDSFAGSGTTAHAVLALNAEDKGSRKVILVECEDYADKVTAERIRRVIKGVPEARDENLRKGFGGAFAFCKLGNPVDEETMFAKKLPDYDTLARYVAHVATGVTLENIRRGKDGFFGEGGEFRLHMIYEPDEDFLISDKAALKRDMAERIGKAAGAKGKRALVFATAKHMSQKSLTPLGVIYCQMPYAMHQVYGERGDAR